MDKDTGVVCFGEKIEGVVYQLRPGAYGVLFDLAGRLAVVSTPRGFYLPGGGCDPGEKPEQTLRREALEECGLLLKGLTKVGEAWEYLYAEQETQYFCKQGVYLSGDVVGYAGEGRESDHRLIWMTPDEALARLTHGSGCWALAQVLRGF